MASNPGDLSNPRESFAKALASVKRASEEGRCAAAKAARRRAISHAKRMGAAGDDEGSADAQKQVEAVPMGICRLRKKKVK